MNGQHGPAMRTRTVRAFYRRLRRVKIDLPTVVIYQLVGFELHVLEIGQEVEKRVAGGRDQYRVSRIA